MLHLLVADPVYEILCFEEPKTLPIASDSTLHVLNTHNFTYLCRSTFCLIYHSENWQLKRHLIAIVLDVILYILESNRHPNLIHTSFCRFLKQKKS